MDTTTTPDLGRDSVSPWLAGARDALPYVASYAPYGLVIGALADRADVDDLVGWSTSWLAYAGSSQLLSIELLGSGAAAAAVVLTVALINMRMLAYAAVLSPAWRGAPWWWTVIATYTLIDPVYLLALERRRTHGSPGADTAADGRRYHLGAALTLWGSWLPICGAGVTVAGAVASSVPSRTLGELMLACMLALVVADRRAGIAAVLGFAAGIPVSHLTPAAAPLAAMLAAVLADRVRPVVGGRR